MDKKGVKMSCRLAEALVDILVEKGIPAVVDGDEWCQGYLRFGSAVNVEHHPSPGLVIKARRVVLEKLACDLAKYLEARGGKQLRILRKGAGRHFRDAMLPEDPLYIDFVPADYKPAVLAEEGLPSRVSAWCYCLAGQEADNMGHRHGGGTRASSDVAVVMAIYGTMMARGNRPLSQKAMASLAGGEAVK